MSEAKIPPAMSEEEWLGYFAMSGAEIQKMGAQRRHMHAALCLHGETFGFTWDDADGLRALADSLRETIGDPTRVAPLVDLADRIAALLPPRGLQPGAEPGPPEDP